MKWLDDWKQHLAIGRAYKKARRHYKPVVLTTAERIAARDAHIKQHGAGWFDGAQATARTGGCATEVTNTFLAVWAPDEATASLWEQVIKALPMAHQTYGGPYAWERDIGRNPAVATALDKIGKLLRRG